MNKASKTMLTTYKIWLLNNKKMIIYGSVILTILLIVPAISLHIISSDDPPTQQDSMMETDSQLKKTENNYINNSSNDINTSTKNNSVTNEEQFSHQTNQTQPDENDDTYQETSNNGPTSYTPPQNNNNNNGGNSDSDESTTEDDPSEEENNNGTNETVNCFVNIPNYSLLARVNLTMAESYFISNITAIFGDYDLQNNSFLTWCIDYGEYMNYSLKNISLFSSYCPPIKYQKSVDNWSSVNYILNNKPKNYSYLDIQTAIWHYINFGTEPQEPTSIAWDLIDEVEANNGNLFVPEPGEKIAVIVESEFEPANDQLSIIELIVPEHPNIQLQKSANFETVEIGQTIQYTYNISNTGDVTLYSLSLSDDKLGDLSLHNTTLSSGNWIIHTLNYTVKESDLPGPINNSAIVLGKTKNNESVNAIDNESVCITYIPQILLVKQADKNFVSVGEDVCYTYNISNIGDVNIFSLNLVDDKIGIIPLNNTTIPPGNWFEKKVTYTIKESDLPGPLVNNATISGITILNQSVNYSASCSIDLSYVASISIKKHAEYDIATLGSTVNYSYQITNNGQVTLKNITLFDDKIGFIPTNLSILAPNECENLTSSYIVTCEDIENDTLVNTAFVNGLTLLNESITNHTTEEITLSYHPNITIDKSLYDRNNHIWVDELNVIEENMLLFNISIKNTGTEALHDIFITDYLPNQLNFAYNASIPPVNSSPHSIVWEISHLEVNESIHITYNSIASLIGNGTNNATVIVDLCNDTLLVSDSVRINVLPCPSEVWVNNKWSNQVYVDMFDSSLILHYDAYNSIQEAVRNVCTCGSVFILNGTYKEQILINKDVHLYGEDSAIIEFPSQLKTFSINGTGAYSPILFAYGGILKNKDVTGNDTIGVLVNGLNFKGSFENNSLGILYHNVETNCAPSIITNCSFEDLNIAIQIDGCSSDTNITYNRLEWADHTVGKSGILITSSYLCEPSNVNINHNHIGMECGNNIGVWNKIDEPVNATLNWWGTPDGPSSPENNTYDFLTNRLANGFGTKVIGNISFDPWAGIDASISASDTDVNVNEFILFSSDDSFACRINGSYYPFYSIKWDFDDGMYSFKKNPCHIFDQNGVYQVKFQVKAIDMILWPSSYMIDFDEITIRVGQI